MTGSNKRGLILQSRDRKFLEELSRMRIVDRELAKIVAGFGSTTRANTRLLQLTRAGFLKRFFVGTIAGGRKAIYALSRTGQALAGSSGGLFRRNTADTLSGDLFLDHQMRVNEIYALVCFGKLPETARLIRWLSFSRPLAPDTALIPDGYFEIEGTSGIRPMFLEVDLGTEALPIWKRKVFEYLRLATSGQFQKLFSQSQFRVLVIATSERRLNIRKAVRQSTDKIFWFSTLSTINRDGLWSPIWLRPSGDQKQSLL